MRPDEQVIAGWALQANIEGVVEWIELFETWAVLHPNTHRDGIPFLFPSDNDRNRDRRDPSREAASRWFMDGFSGAGARRWMEAGLPPEEFDLARELREAHVVAAHLNDEIADPVTKEPSTVLWVAVTAPQHFATVGDALDAAGYAA